MLKWAILGTGFISNTVVDAITASVGSRVELVAGRNRERVLAFQAAHQIPRYSLEYEAAVADSGIDAVYIGTPNHHHHPLVIAAAEAGKVILSEKSLTTTMESAGALVDAVRGNVFFVEGLMYLAHPMYRGIQDMLSSDLIGRVTAVHAHYAADIAAVVNPLGRGTIYNLGCYPVSLLQLVMQSMFDGGAFSNHVITGTGTVTSDGTVGAATAGVSFANGVTATLACSDNYGMSHAFTVLTDRGELQVETNPWLPEAGDNVVTWRPYDGEPVTTIFSDQHDAFYHQIVMIEDAVRDGRLEALRPSPTLDDSLEIMEFLTTWEQACLS